MFPKVYLCIVTHLSDIQYIIVRITMQKRFVTEVLTGRDFRITNLVRL